MSSWRDTILNAFVPNVSKLTLVADPDSLLTEEKLAQELRQRGFDLIEFTDPIEFRFVYESKYRSIWDRGDHTDLVVVLRLHNAELDALPYDLLQAGRKLSFNLGDLFPNLSYPVIEKLDRSLLDALFEAQKTFPSDRMGDNATRDFILRHVFGIAAELIKNEVDLLRALLRIHYSETHMAQDLADRFVQVLQSQTEFKTWPLNEIVPDEQAFFAFLQERWPVFLGSLRKTEGIQEVPPEYGMKYPGPGVLPFDHQDIRVYIDNLFVEGRLAPVSSSALTSGLVVEVTSWIRCGIIEVKTDDDDVRIARLFDLLEKELPTQATTHSQWTTFALKWAELSALIHNNPQDNYQSRYQDMGAVLNTTFTEWLQVHYASLINSSPSHPAMLHHVARRLARDMEESRDLRVALIVVDGLALDQWVTVRQILQEQDHTLAMQEYATFAWIPTITSVSRQSIFSGKPPLYFPSSIHTTNNESALWRQFWEGCGLSRLDIAYKRGLGDGNVLDVIEDTIHPGTTKAVGLVVDMVDKIMHGMQLGATGMHNQIKQWCQGGFLSGVISYLLDNGYEVWLTSDHGNMECKGKGRPSEGVIAELRGQRARVYPTPELCSQVATAFLFAHTWQPVGLPPDYFPLVTGGRDAFANPNDSLVGHGGIAIEEVIVPLVKFKRKIR